MESRHNRIFVPADAVRENEAAIVGAEAHHILHVLRLGPGDDLIGTNGQGNESLLKIERVGPQTVICRIVESRVAVCPETKNRIVLMQSCLSSGKMDQVIDKGTQLGVARFVPVVSEKSKFQGDEARLGKKVERWSRIARASSLQCGRAFFPEVSSIVPLTEAVAFPQKGDKMLLFSPSGDVGTAGVVLPDVLSSLNETSGVYVMIGPESGLSEVEERVALRYGFVPVRMGSRVLRAETAPVVAVALVLSHLGEL